MNTQTQFHFKQSCLTILLLILLIVNSIMCYVTTDHNDLLLNWLANEDEDYLMRTPLHALSFSSPWVIHVNNNHLLIIYASEMDRIHNV
uniref:Uncharacterized protein n=1 Tax=Trichobilharzia regenti TaxID=157069 RepID=A0AA85J8E7_TRIRE|nr:unnamed protein product [Trichobilharzia regenti]